MLGSTALTAVLGSGVDNRDPEAVKAFVRSAADIGLSLLFIAPETKVPVDLRTPQARTKDDKAAQQEARDAGRRDWAHVKSPSGLALATSNKTVLDRYLKRYLALYADRYPDGVPVNIAVEVGGSGLIVIDCDTAAQMARFYEVCGIDTAPVWYPDEDHPEGGTWVSDVPPPTVITPGQRGPDAVDDDPSTWAHSDGGHFYFTVPDELMPTLPRNMGAMTWGGDDGFAVLWDRRYVLIPPSTRPEGAYELLGRDYEAEDWLVEKITEAAARRFERAERNINRDRENASDLDMAIDEWAEATPWSAILEPLGWSMAPRADACGCPVWTAPGIHASPKSATAHDTGCSLGRYTAVNAPLHLWTDHDAEPFTDDMSEPGWSPTFSKLQAVALVSFGGGVGRAMDELGLTPDLSVELDPDVAPKQVDPEHGMTGDGDFSLPVTEDQPPAPTPPAATPEQMEAAEDDGTVVCQCGDTITPEDARQSTDGVWFHGDHLIDAADGEDEPMATSNTPTGPAVDLSLEDLPADFGKKVKTEESPYAGVNAEDVDPDIFESKHPGVPRIAPFSHWRDMPPPEYIIEGLLEHGGLSSIIGPPGIGKSTVVLDMACHIAVGKRWRGRTTRKTRVLYLPGEGLSGAVQRLRAWESLHELELGRDLLLGDSIILIKATNEAWGDLAAYIARHEIGLVIFDTFARQSSGLEENSATDVGTAVRRYDKLKELTTAGVCVVHHTGKGDPNSGRGSSALNGALDSELLIKEGHWDTTGLLNPDGHLDGKALELWVSKQKNAEQPEDPIALLMRNYPEHDINAPVITGPNGQTDPMQGEIVLARPRPEPVIETAIRIRAHLDNLPKQGATRAELVLAVMPDPYTRSRKDAPVYWKQRIAEAVDLGLRRDLIETLTGTASGSRYIPSFATGEQARAATAAEIGDTD